MTPRTLHYGNYGIFLIMGNAGFLPSTVVREFWANPCSTKPPNLLILKLPAAPKPCKHPAALSLP